MLAIPALLTKYHRAIAASLAVLAIAAGVIWNTRTAGGADAYGYVSQADLWLSGQLQIDQRFARSVPWPDARWTFAPLGYRPSLDGTSIVPIYSPGLPLLMAAAKAVAGHCAMFWVVPIFGGILVFATYAIGAGIGRPLVGLAAAWLVATSPTFLFMLMTPLSDVPVAAALAAAIALLMQPTSARSIDAGTALGLTVLIRPNLAPLAMLTILWTVWQSVRGQRQLRHVVWLIAGFLPCVIAVAIINTRLYGSPTTSGYENLWRLFQWEHVVPNVTRYLSWHATAEPFLAAGLVVLLLPLRRLWPTGRSRRTLLLFVALVVATWAQYCFYQVFDAWWYLRFLLPTWPALAIGAASLAAALWAGQRPLQYVGIVTLVMMGVWGIVNAERRHVFRQAAGESKYTDVAPAVASIVPADGVVLSMQHSGSLRYYGGRMTLRWDFLDPSWTDRAVDWLSSRGHHPFLLLERWEVDRLRAEFGRSSAVGRLDWQPLASFRNGEVLLFDAVRRDNQQPPAALAPLESRTCVLPAEPLRFTLR